MTSDDASIFSLSAYFKKNVWQLYAVVLILDKFFLKYEGTGDGLGGGVQIDPPPEKTNYPQKAQL